MNKLDILKKWNQKKNKKVVFEYFGEIYESKAEMRKTKYGLKIIYKNSAGETVYENPMNTDMLGFSIDKECELFTSDIIKINDQYYMVDFNKDGIGGIFYNGRFLSFQEFKTMNYTIVGSLKELYDKKDVKIIKIHDTTQNAFKVAWRAVPVQGNLQNNLIAFVAILPNGKVVKDIFESSYGNFLSSLDILPKMLLMFKEAKESDEFIFLTGYGDQTFNKGLLIGDLTNIWKSKKKIVVNSGDITEYKNKITNYSELKDNLINEGKELKFKIMNDDIQNLLSEVVNKAFQGRYI